ncbi:hypothetical protein TUM12370_15870 [Salmonella enterica subsp. enterica serovar Choleraesuis]|nr:hypothetical protein TUM12370_15870 [Salmonella enterica subsp. enterica serovar Choleraesuis]
MGFFEMAAWYETENLPFALLQLIERRGSTPLHSASMLVDGQGEIHGTLGGGMLERLAIDEALQALIQEENRLFEARLTRQGDKAVGADCGGSVTIHIAVYPSRPELYLLGGGHVNREVAKAACAAGFRTTVCDTWEKNLQHPDLPEPCSRVYGANFDEIVGRLPLSERSYVVIATNHEDYEALSAVIKSPLAYLGLLGSRRKVQTLHERLIEHSAATPLQLENLRAPLGLDIGAQTPGELAISIVGELIQTRRQSKKATVSSRCQMDNPPLKTAAKFKAEVTG